jgi:molybdate transport system substrate-binding protein
MAADIIYPEKLRDQSLVSGGIKTYAFGKLVLWSNVLDVSKGLSVLSESAVKRIAVAKPELAPYGNRALECLKYYKLFDKVKDKLVYADNIAQTAQFAQTGNAEVAFIAFALTTSPEMKGSVYELDTKSYKPVEQAMVLLKTQSQNPEAKRFMDFVLGATCKPIFEKYGFIVPTK